MKKSALIEQFYDAYTAVKKEAEDVIRKKGRIDFSYLLTDTEDEYWDERPVICITDRHGMIIWDVVEEVYWETHQQRVIMVLNESGKLPINYCDGYSAFNIYRDVLLTD